MILFLIVCGTVAMAAGLALVSLAPPTARLAYVMPAVRTTALITIAAVYAAALWGR